MSARKTLSNPKEQRGFHSLGGRFWEGNIFMEIRNSGGKGNSCMFYAGLGREIYILLELLTF